MKITGAYSSLLRSPGVLSPGLDVIPWLLAQTFPSYMFSYWTFWLEGHWHTVTFPSSEMVQFDEVRTFPRQQLQRCGLINQVIGRSPAFSDIAERERASRRIDALLAQAAELGLPTAEDQAAFAFHGLNLRDSFWTSPKFLPLLQQARSAPDFSMMKPAYGMKNAGIP
ncbi:hypothetical protein O0544_18855 [Edwardsiella anguillarum]|nr:hypothetical protein [Edwardsiella anguillarum]